MINVRSFYYRNEQMYTDYIDAHPSTQGAKISETVATPESRTARNNANMLLSKINAAMLTKCNQNVTPAQVFEL